MRIESLLQYLYSYFAHSFKRHLEFTRIMEFMVTKGNKIFQNVKTRWISKLSHAKTIMAKYKIVLVKMALDNPTNLQAMLNYEHFCDYIFCLDLLTFPPC